MNLFKKITAVLITHKLRIMANAVIEVFSSSDKLSGTIDPQELLRRCDDATRFVPVVGAALAVNVALHGSRTLVLNTATGTTLTLPAATGSGVEFDVLLGVNVAGGSHIIKVASATDYMMGNVYTISDDAGNPVKGFMSANSGVVATESDTITLNGTTTGGLKGDFFRLRDAANAQWQVLGHDRATGVEATPFSAAV